MKLSKQERKFRMKIIQEWNLKKKEQIQLDNSVKASGKNYCSFYADAILGLTTGFFASVSLQRAIKKLDEIGISTQEAANAFSSFRGAWDALWEGANEKCMDS